MINIISRYIVFDPIDIFGCFQMISAIHKERPGVINGPQGKAGEVIISWSAGCTYGNNGLSSANVTIEFSDHTYSLVDNNIITIWEEPYVLGIRGSFTIAIDGREDFYRYAIDATYYIPSSYHCYGIEK